MNTPYISELKATLDTQKELLSLLEKKAYELEKNRVFSDESIESLNLQIDLIDTKAHMETVKKVIAQKSDYFEKFSKNFEIEYSEMLTNYKAVMERAEKLKFKIPHIETLLKASDEKKSDENRETRLFFYKKIKALLP
jgi:hypothetical protein